MSGVLGKKFLGFMYFSVSSLGFRVWMSWQKLFRVYVVSDSSAGFRV